jgi:hypothetical protein
MNIKKLKGSIGLMLVLLAASFWLYFLIEIIYMPLYFGRSFVALIVGVYISVTLALVNYYYDYD